MLALLLRKIVPLFTYLALLTLGASAYGDPKPLTKEEQAKVDKAIDKGVAFLKRVQHDKGDWPLYMRSRYVLGQTLLPAYALLESGVPADAPCITKAAEYIRPRVLKLDWTYEVSLAVLFLDRLGDPKDKPLIRNLALRLIAGQHVTGGWNYRCPTLKKEQEDTLVKALTELTKGQAAGEKTPAKILKELEIPHSFRALTIFRDPSKLPWREPHHGKETEPMYTLQLAGATTNSNTQFALLALWAAQRHEIPVTPTFRLMVERFERSQLVDGWWPYQFENYNDPDWIKRHPSMICVGLLSLAVGRGLKLSTPGSAQQGSADLHVLKSLAALSQDIGVAAANLEKANSMRGTYYLWSLERVAMLYALPTIGDKDWYRWGSTILLASQKSDGSWKDVKVSGKDQLVQGPNWGLVPNIDTSFALLFLKPSHPMKELTPKLPFKAKELNQGIAKLLSGVPLEPSTTTPGQSEKPKR
ncbi:MAG TPA: hypothetical protein VH643_39025 [Gemmataceae bacterium]|jgi:hypothetical protein